MDRYPPIADHGLIGDLQTTALVSSGGVVDWFAAPRFDAPSVFANLIDYGRGGYFQISPDHPEASVKQLYYPDSAVLVTRCLSPEGVSEVVDWMPPNPTKTPTDRHTIYRLIRVVRGTVCFNMECRPRFDYARAEHDLTLNADGAVFRSPKATAYLQGANFPMVRDGDDVRGSVTLGVGQLAALVFTFCERGGPAPPPMNAGQISDRSLEDTEFWQRWVRGSTYNGRWPATVHRAAITLKLLTYAPTGAPIAAATTGLPERIGGERNWDYRYTWVRDGSLSVRALLDIGLVDEATQFTHWLRDRLEERAGRPGEPLQTMYRVDGEAQIPEETLGHLEGYHGSAPVRIGNAAAEQLQLDIYGEALYALSEGHQLSRSAGYHDWKLLSGMVDWLAENWDRPDEGIWETRGGRQNFTYSRVMSWVAFDRAVKLAEEFSRPGHLNEWRSARDEILDQIMTRGWSETEQALVQHYGSDVLDASLLLIPRLCLLSPNDPQWYSTLDAMRGRLVSDSLVYRYDPAASPDGLQGCEGTFSLCSFLYVDALAEAGHLPQARYAFEKMLSYANHVGLFGEEVGPAGEQLGNFPQAFTHLALIMAATKLDAALDAAQA